MTDDQAASRWRQLATQELGGRDAADLRTRSPAGAEVKPLYTSNDLLGIHHLHALPGDFPYVRGVRASMYVARPWTLRQYAGFSGADETNAFFRQALAGGQRGLSVAFDLATHRGYDSDDPLVVGDVGKAGVAVDSVEDMKAIFEGIPLEHTSVSMTMNGAVLPVLAAFIVAGEEQGTPRQCLAGTIQNDILKEFMVRNTYIYPPAPSRRIVAEVMQSVSESMPRYNSVSVSGYHMQEAGASAELELGYTLADGLEYLRAATERGLAVDDVGKTLSFFFGVGLDFFTEVAKLRAARLLWATLVRERFAPHDARTLMLRMHCQTSGVSLAAQDPLNNVVRTTVEALAAVLGGTQSLHTNAYDEALALPSDPSARLARNTQLILQHETGITDVVDPLAGSYFLEHLTQQLAERARAIIQEVDAAGGMTRAIELRLPQSRIERAAAERQAAVDRGEVVVVGVNRFVAADEPELELRTIDTAAVLARQRESLAKLRASRDQSQVASALAALANGAAGSANLLELAVHAMRARATVGEVSAALAGVFGRYQGASTTMSGVFTSAYADDTAWAALRARVAAFGLAEGRRPRILLAKLGQDGHDRGVKVVAAGLVDLGFDVDLGPLFQTPMDVARQAIDGDVHFVGISTQAGGHLALVPELLRALRAAGADDIGVVVGGIVPARDRPLLASAGVAAIFGPGDRVTHIAEQLLGLCERRQPAGTKGTRGE